MTHYTTIIMRSPQNSIGSYLGPYSSPCGFGREQKTFGPKGSVGANGLADLSFRIHGEASVCVYIYI